MNATLVVTPTSRTRERLQNMMLSAPFALEFDQMLISLVTTITSGEQLPWEVNPWATYDDVRVVELHPKLVWKEEGYYVRVLRATVSSEQLTRRSIVLEQPAELFGWVLTNTMQESRPVRSFLASFADALIHHEEEPFSFSNEQVVTY